MNEKEELLNPSERVRGSRHGNMICTYMDDIYIEASDYEENSKIIRQTILEPITNENVLDNIVKLGEVFNMLAMYNIDPNDADGINKTDCITTSKSIWMLFNPHIYSNITFEPGNRINNSDIDMYNILLMSIGTGLPFHKFVAIRTTTEWIIMCSYTRLYTVRFIFTDNLIKDLNNLINGSSSTYNELFNTNIDYDEGSVLRITPGIYSNVPHSKLQLWINNYL